MNTSGFVTTKPRPSINLSAKQLDMLELFLDPKRFPLPEGECRTVYACYECGKLSAHDYIPYGIGRGRWQLGCNCGIGQEREWQGKLLPVTDISRTTAEETVNQSVSTTTTPQQPLIIVEQPLTSKIKAEDLPVRGLCRIKVSNHQRIMLRIRYVGDVENDNTQFPWVLLLDLVSGNVDRIPCDAEVIPLPPSTHVTLHNPFPERD